MLRLHSYNDMTMTMELCTRVCRESVRTLRVRCVVHANVHVRTYQFIAITEYYIRAKILSYFLQSPIAVTAMRQNQFNSVNGDDVVALENYGYFLYTVTSPNEAYTRRDVTKPSPLSLTMVDIIFFLCTTLDTPILACTTEKAL